MSASRAGAIAMPVVEKRRMFFRRFDGEECLEPGVFGTRHPNAGLPTLDPDFIVAPLAAFDRRADASAMAPATTTARSPTFTRAATSPRLAGIAFACQEVDAVPLEAHDARLPLIATERELIEAERPA